VQRQGYTQPNTELILYFMLYLIYLLTVLCNLNLYTFTNYVRALTLTTAGGLTLAPNTSMWAWKGVHTKHVQWRAEGREVRGVVSCRVRSRRAEVPKFSLDGNKTLKKKLLIFYCMLRERCERI
jgi:hypothetical protein